MTELEAETAVSIREGIVSRIYPSIVSFAQQIKKERDRDILVARLNGVTLEEIGQRYGLTRERVRQLLGKALLNRPHVQEDKYLYLFENYDFSLEDFKLAFGERDAAYYYLMEATSSVKSKRKPVDESLLTDSEIPIKMRKQAEKAVYKNYLLIDGVRVKKTRQDLVEYVIRTRCRDLTKFDDFMGYYHDQIIACDLQDDSKMALDSGTYTNKLSEANFVLWNQGRSFRYYYIPERDYELLLTTIDLKNYKNTILSSLKFFKDFPELMQEYDIRDEYELHNLLKKILPEDPEIEFKRMPTIAIGTADRDEWSGEQFDFEGVSEESIRSGNYTSPFMNCGLNYLTGTLDVDIQMENIPDDEGCPVKTIYHYSNGTEVQFEMIPIDEDFGDGDKKEMIENVDTASPSIPIPDDIPKTMEELTKWFFDTKVKGNYKRFET